jgi:hypothetical protein
MQYLMDQAIATQGDQYQYLSLEYEELTALALAVDFYAERTAKNTELLVLWDRNRHDCQLVGLPLPFGPSAQWYTDADLATEQLILLSSKLPKYRKHSRDHALSLALSRDTYLLTRDATFFRTKWLQLQQAPDAVRHSYMHSAQLWLEGERGQATAVYRHSGVQRPKWSSITSAIGVFGDHPGSSEFALTKQAEWLLAPPVEESTLGCTPLTNRLFNQSPTWVAPRMPSEYEALLLRQEDYIQAILPVVGKPKESFTVIIVDDPDV